MKKTLTALAAALLLVAVAACASAQTMYVDTPNGRALNLRNSDDEVIAQIPNRARDCGLQGQGGLCLPSLPEHDPPCGLGQQLRQRVFLFFRQRNDGL